MDKAANKAENTSTDYGVLHGDIAFIRKNEQLLLDIQNIQHNINVAKKEYENYNHLTLEESTRFDGHLTYCVNSLFWMAQKLSGNTNMMLTTKQNLQRVQSTLSRTNEVHENIYCRPRIHQPAAKRFIRAGINVPKHKTVPKENMKSKALKDFQKSTKKNNGDNRKQD
ncbi:uncharacterized protein LOC128269293 [Anopheles cruzii]|uniref:uncharacterized protein LOC128269293 n=1 Tax=Anopheles cruzii TaxID=68878 RepID=UPI0022EC1FAA|nr:uncharacterized protein LOC128269293 [Anopheles cruzii]XP_052862693.1 uncharacterized protein LOC128269293 [Anopheles cruzii]